jgi:hypothetical protein
MQVSYNSGVAAGTKIGVTWTLTCGASTFTLRDQVVNEATGTQFKIVSFDELFTAVPAGVVTVTLSGQADEGTTTANISIGKSALDAIVFNV